MSSEAPPSLPPSLFGKLLESGGAWIEENATAIVAAACVVVVGASGYTWWSRQANATSTAAWTLLEAAENVGDFANVAEKYKNTPAGNWATLRAAELNLKSGSDMMFTNRELAVQELKRAREDFTGLLSSSTVDAQIRERAAWGLALALESTSDGDTTKAIEAYERLIADFPETIYKSLAEQRITSLKTGGVKDFYSWFSKQSPKPADPRPKDGMSKGDLDSFLPSPSDSTGDKKTTEEGATEKKEATEPSDSKNKEVEPKSEKPSDAKEESDKKDASKPPAPAEPSSETDASTEKNKEN